MKIEEWHDANKIHTTGVHAYDLMEYYRDPPTCDCGYVLDETDEMKAWLKFRLEVNRAFKKYDKHIATEPCGAEC